MSCSPEVVNWMNKCYDEEVASALVKSRDFSEEHSHSFISFKNDIKDKSGKTKFRGHHLQHRSVCSPDNRHGYEIQVVNPLPPYETTAAGYLKKTKDFPAMSWSSAIICGYDPKRDNIMFEVSSKERGYSYHTMKMSKFERLIQGDYSRERIIIKKII